MVTQGTAICISISVSPKESPVASLTAYEPLIRRAIHDLVASLGGSFSAEHGIGRLKVGELQRYTSAVELATMRSIKQALDPRGIMNPGKAAGRVLVRIEREHPDQSFLGGAGHQHALRA